MSRTSTQQRFLRITPTALLALLAFFFPAPARAQQITLELDPAKTRVEFTLDAVLHTVHGTFKAKSGKIEVDPATGKATGQIVLDAPSAETGNDGRDSKMHKEILESQKYPEITFAPTQVEGTISPRGDSHVQLRGVIGIHGSRQEIVTPVDVHITGGEWTAETAFPVLYVKWGLKNPSTFLLRVKDTVNLTVHAAGRLTPASSQ